jgi:CHASE3 domain
MNRLTLRMKLGLGFGGLLLILAAMGFVANSSVGQLADISERAGKVMTKTYLASQIEAGLEKQTSGARAYMLAGREDLLQHDQEGKQQFNDSMDNLSALVATEEGHRLYGEIQSSYGEYRAIVDREIELPGRTKKRMPSISHSAPKPPKFEPACAKRLKKWFAFKTGARKRSSRSRMGRSRTRATWLCFWRSPDLAWESA